MDKKIIWMLMFFVLISSVYAGPEKIWWKLDGNYSDSSGNGNNLTEKGTGNVFNTTSYIQGTASLQTTNAGNAANTTSVSNGMPTGNTPVSITWWLFTPSGHAGAAYAWWLGKNVDDQHYFCYDDAAGNLKCTNDGGASSVATALPTGTWNFFVLSYSNSISALYKDNVFQASLNVGVMDWNYDTGASLLARFNDANSYIGKMDDFRVFNLNLTADNRSFLYGGGAGTNLSLGATAAPPTADNFSIIVRDYNTDGLLQNILVTLSNDTSSYQQYTSSIGEATFVVNGTYNITLTNASYITNTLYNHQVNRTNDINYAEVWQSEMTVTAKRAMSGASILSFNASAGNESNSTSIGSVRLRLNASTTFTLSVNSSTYYTNTTTFSLNPAESRAASLSLYQSNFTIRVLDSSGNQITTSTKINITSKNSSYIYETTTTTGNITIFAVDDHLNVTAESAGNYIKSSSIFIPKGSIYVGNMTLKKWNTINLTFIDEETLSYVGNVTVIISSQGFSNSTTSHYSMNWSFLDPGEYNLIYHSTNAGGYFERFRWIYIQNSTYTDLPLYLLKNSTGGEDFTVTLLNQLSEELSGYVVVARKFLPNQTAYINVQSEKTNEDGIARFKLLRGNNQYVFNVLDPEGYSLIHSTNLTKLFDTSRTIKVTIGAIDFTSNLLTAWRLGTNGIFYDNVTKLINFTWFTLGGTNRVICFNVSMDNHTNTTLLFSQCSGAQSGSMTYNVSGVDGLVRGVAYIQGSIYIVDLYEKFITTSQELWELIGEDGLILYIIIQIIMASISLTNISVLPFMLGVGHLLGWWWGLIPIEYGVSGVIIIVILIIITLRLKD